MPVHDLSAYYSTDCSMMKVMVGALKSKVAG